MFSYLFTIHRAIEAMIEAFINAPMIIVTTPTSVLVLGKTFAISQLQGIVRMYASIPDMASCPVNIGIIEITTKTKYAVTNM